MRICWVALCGALSGCFLLPWNIKRDQEELQRRREAADFRSFPGWHAAQGPHEENTGDKEKKPESDKKADEEKKGEGKGTDSKKAEESPPDTECQTLLKQLAVAGAACVVEQHLTGAADCTEATCPECARLIKIRKLLAERKC